MILSFINIRKVPREMLKTSGFALGFQHLPRDLANVNEWKIMFDPYISKYRQYSSFTYYQWKQRYLYMGPSASRDSSPDSRNSVNGVNQ